MKRGEVVVNRRGQYCLREQLAGLTVGTVQAQRNGDGWLLPDDGSAQIYLPAQQMREVMHGDRIAARIEGARFRGKAQGTIVEVLERRTNEVVGRLHVESGVAYLTPDNPRITHRVLVPSAELGGAESGQVVIVELTQQPSRTNAPVGRVSRVLGDHGAPGMETDIAIHSHSLPFEFPDEVIAEAEAYGRRIPQDAIAGREDLRGHGTRHDRRRRRARFRRRRVVRTHAARAGSSSSRSPTSRITCGRARRSTQEARERGTSVYFPNRVLPMLPEALSNGLCSLVPARGPAVPVLRIARQRRRPHHALALLRGRHALRGAPHVSRGRQVPREAEREASRAARETARAAARRCTASTSRSRARAAAAARSNSTRPN